MRKKVGLILLVWVGLLSACTTPGESTHVTRANQDFELGDIAKTDINLVIEAHHREALGYLRLLALKLYQFNPRQWEKSGSHSAQASVDRMFNSRHNWNFSELEGATGADAIHLSLDESFQGDRVLAFTVGLGSMIIASYEGKYDFFVIDSLDAQKLNNSARNLEIAAWKLYRSHDPEGNPLIQTGGSGNTTQNLSFERLFGKIIAVQDLMSKIVAQKTKRGVKSAIQFLMFLPI
ncbi:MAG: hypothetical protein HQL72_14215 [Magnetococcales bacterium]|nr:hypothetical protein [Magnetococcales bacterium]